MEYVIEGSSRSRKFISLIVPSMLVQLGLNKSKKTLLIRVANECDGNAGATYNFDAIDSYVVIIKPNRNLNEIGLTLAHELVHVRQLAKGILKPIRGGRHVWAGKTFGKKTKYLDQPWEIDAFARQEIVFRKSLENL